MSKTLVEMTAEIIQSQITSKQMTTDEIKTALNEIFQALKIPSRCRSRWDAGDRNGNNNPRDGPQKIHPEKQDCLS